MAVKRTNRLKKLAARKPNTPRASTPKTSSSRLTINPSSHTTFRSAPNRGSTIDMARRQFGFSQGPRRPLTPHPPGTAERLRQEYADSLRRSSGVPNKPSQQTVLDQEKKLQDQLIAVRPQEGQTAAERVQNTRRRAELQVQDPNAVQFQDFGQRIAARGGTPASIDELITEGTINENDIASPEIKDYGEWYRQVYEPMSAAGYSDFEVDPYQSDWKQNVQDRYPGLDQLPGGHGYIDPLDTTSNFEQIIGDQSDSINSLSDQIYNLQNQPQQNDNGNQDLMMALLMGQQNEGPQQSVYYGGSSYTPGGNPWLT